MIGRLRKKFIVLTMLSVLFLLAVVLGCINVVNIYQTNAAASQMLSYLLENDMEVMWDNNIPSDNEVAPPERGKQPDDDAMPENRRQPENTELPEEKNKTPAITGTPSEAKPLPNMNPETLYTTRYFSVHINKDGDIIRTDTNHIAAVSKEEAADYAYQVMDSGKSTGFLGIYKYATIEREEGIRIVFLDCNDKISSCMTVVVTSLVIGGSSYLLLLFLITALSRKVVQPVIKNLERQKQFVSDAGHELKTPIAIISANADVLSLTMTDNQWIHSIKNQTRRMDDLVKELLMLNRIEEKKEVSKFQEISLSEIAEDMVNSFGILAEQKEKMLTANVEQGLLMKGDKNEIRNIFSVLLDNAIKYSLPKSEIKLCVQREKHKYKITVQNHCEPITEGNLDNMFERFYRLDSSRSRETGGFGIGLSIAKEAVKLHKGTIRVDYTKKEGICFIVELGF